MPKSDIVADRPGKIGRVFSGRGAAYTDDAGMMKVWAELSPSQSAAASVFLTVEDILAESAEDKPDPELTE